MFVRSIIFKTLLTCCCIGLGMTGVAEFIPLALGVGVQEKENNPNLPAKEAAEKFMKAIIKPNDIEYVMTLVDLPFFFDGDENINDRENLKKSIEPLLNPRPAQIEYKVKNICLFGSLPKQVFSDQDHKLLKEILEKSDRIVFFQFSNSVTAIAVRGQKDKAKVVGIRTDLPLLALAFFAPEKGKGDGQSEANKETAKRTAQGFLKAANAKDLDGLVKLADVPWYSDGNRIIKDREELKKVLKTTWVDRAAKDEIPPANVIRISNYEEIRDLLKESRRNLADQVFAKDDLVVFVRGEGKKRGGMLFVRVRESKGKIIGVGQ